MGNLTMPADLDKYRVLFNDLSLRSRLLITLSAAAILFMLFDLLWLSNNGQIIKQTNNKIVSLSQEKNNLLDTQRTKNQKISSKRNDPKYQLIESLDQQLEQAKVKLKERTLNLVQPEDMAEVLNTIIASSNKLKLQSLSKLETTKLSDKTPVDPKAKDQEALVELYRHRMQIVLNGSYSATYQFLEKLESMEKQVAFDNLEYEVDAYPQAEIKLIVSTLSLNKEWIGG